MRRTVINARTVFVAGLIAMALAAAFTLARAQEGGVDSRPPNATTQKPAFAGQTRAPERKAGVAFEVVTVAEGFQNPWSVAFLPGGKMLVTGRPGRLRAKMQGLDFCDRHDPRRNRTRF